MSRGSWLKQVGIRQNAQAEMIVFSFDVSAQDDGTSDGLLEGKNYATIAKTGTGDYTFTLNRPSLRPIVFLGGAVAGEAFVRLNALPDEESFRIIIEDDAGTNSDLDVQFAIMAFYDPTER
jgi:hypothetical protein